MSRSRQWPRRARTSGAAEVAVAAAAAIAAAAGCGSVAAPAQPDGGAVDASPLGLVRVLVLSTTGDGQPDPSATVVVQAPDGSVIADAAVAADGTAQAMIPPGAQVSAIRLPTDTATTLDAQVTTITGVRPGDALVFGLRAAPAPTTVGGQTTMSASFSPATGASRYNFFTPCGLSIATATPATLTFRDGCHGAAFDLLATTVAAGVPMFLKVAAVNYQSGGAFAIPATFAPMDTFTVHLTNTPDAIGTLAVTRASMVGHLPIASTTVTPAGDPPAGAVDVALSYPQGFGTRSELSVLIGRPDATISQRHDAHTASLLASATVDLGAHRLPWLTDLAQTATGARWTQVAAGDAPDGQLLTWRGRWTDGARAVQVAWNVVGPAAPTASLPRLPARWARVDPGQQPGQVVPAGVTLYLADYDVLDGYDALRQMPETLLTTTPGTLGAFVGMPFERRISVASADVIQ